MTISIDSNVLSALWNEHDAFNKVAGSALRRLECAEIFVISGPVYGELLAGPLKSEENLDLFLAATEISVDWLIDEEIWREAGRAFSNYAARRRKSGSSAPRRILADFVIGAHAMLRGHSILTLDPTHFEAAFPAVTVIPVTEGD